MVSGSPRRIWFGVLTRSATARGGRKITGGANGLRRNEEKRRRQEAGCHEETSADDASAAKDPRNVQGQAGAVARSLPIVALDLAPKMAEDECPRSDDEEAQEAEAVRQPAAQDSSGDEVEQGENDDLLIVRSAAARSESHDLEESGELHRHVERRAACQQPYSLHDQQ